MLDNIQRLCDDTLRNQAHRTVHLSQISKQLAKIAKDYKVKTGAHSSAKAHRKRTDHHDK